MDPLKVKTILEWQAPTPLKGVCSFLGFAEFYRCFVKDFSDIAAPLIELTKKLVWKWGASENVAFEKAEENLCD